MSYPYQLGEDAFAKGIERLPNKDLKWNKLNEGLSVGPKDTQERKLLELMWKRGWDDAAAKRDISRLNL